MELRHLRYFVAVAEAGGLRRAADRLNIAQPAVSRQIKDLEAELGFDLLARVGRGVALTDAGAVFFEEAKIILAQAVEAARRAKQVAEGRGGLLRIGLLENASWTGHAPDALHRFARNNPNIKLDIAPLSSLEQLDAIAAGTLDGGFLYLQGDAVRRDLASVHLRTDGVVLATSKDLVFERDGPLKLEDIDGLPMIDFPRDVAPEYYDSRQRAMADIGFVPNVVQTAGDETTMLSLVSAGVGSALVNNSNMGRPPPKVAFHEVEGLRVPIEFHFAHHAYPGSMVTLFLEALSSITGEVMP